MSGEFDTRSVCFYDNTLPFYLKGWGFQVVFFFHLVSETYLSHYTILPFTFIEIGDSPPPPSVIEHKGKTAQRAQPPSTGLYPNPQMAKQTLKIPAREEPYHLLGQPSYLY